MQQSKVISWLIKNGVPRKLIMPLENTLFVNVKKELDRVKDIMSCLKAYTTLADLCFFVFNPDKKSEVFAP